MGKDGAGPGKGGKRRGHTDEARAEAAKVKPETPRVRVNKRRKYTFFT